MGSIFSSPKIPTPDNSAAERARAEAEAKAKKEQDELKAKQDEEEDAIRRGLRGRRALLSDAGGELGFPSTLGG